MAEQPENPDPDTGDTPPLPEDNTLDAPGSGDLGSGTDGGAAATATSAGKALAQKGVEAGVKKATGSDVAVSAVRGAQKARRGDMVGGAQDVAASGAGALTTAAIGATGAGAPVAGLAGSAVTTLFQTKAFRYLLTGVAAIVVASLVLQTVIISGVTAAIVSAVLPSVSQAAMSTQACSNGGGGDAGAPGEVVGGDIEEKVWNYLRGAGYSDEQTAGVMGNIERESGFNPFIAQGEASTPSTSSGWGLVQWTGIRHVEIRDAVIDELGADYYIAAPNMQQLPATMTEQDVDSLVLFQLRYIIAELEGVENVAGDHLASTTTVEEATKSFEAKYERSGVVAIDERIANAQAFYAQYAGAATPDVGGTENNPSTDAPAPARSGDEGTDCTGSTISPGSNTGSVTPCPSGMPDCVNIAALIQPSASLSCPAETTDQGTATAYYQGQGKPIRLCALDGVTDLNGRPIVMNATIAPEFMKFWTEAEEQGLELTLTSSYRSHAKQQSLYSNSPGGAARPGWSNHEFGMAFDIGGFPTSYSRHNCGSTQTPELACYFPGTGADLQRWQKLRELGLKHGMYIHDEEFWHIEFIPSGLDRGRNIDVYEG
ncbi:PE-PGRS virulence associated protein [Corynebacterium xerosis]|uniref:phage tail tip lysozyme n=1 Tax=Brachybacterium tyrofermentans TaxID=47848 RepID=UPI000A1B6C69|nr:PE-PGRS virulence associated protein [Corynebacterium xerosis]